MLELLKALKDLEQIEIKMGELYQGFAEHFRDDSEANLLFNHLWMEEMSHQNILQYESRLVLANPKGFREIVVDRSMLERSLALIDRFRRNNPRPTLEEALRMAFVMENSSAELYYLTVFKAAVPELGGFVANLHTGSKTHYEKLERFAKKRGVNPPESIAVVQEILSPPHEDMQASPSDASTLAKGC